MGSADDLASTIESDLTEIRIRSYNAKSTLFVLRIDHIIGMKLLVSKVKIYELLDGYGRIHQISVEQNNEYRMKYI